MADEERMGSETIGEAFQNSEMTLFKDDCA